MKTFIEVSFPGKKVSVESAREKNIRDGHISALHTWWARRTLASSRATTYAALIPTSENNIELSRSEGHVQNLLTLFKL